MQIRRPESRRHRSHLLVEERLSLRHQFTERLRVTIRHILDGTIHDLQVILTQGLMLCTLRISAGERVGFVQVRQDPDCILFRTEVCKDPVQVFLHIEGAYLDLITIEGHQIGFDTKGTGLIQTTTTATGTEFTHIGDIHLTQCVEVQII